MEKGSELLHMSQELEIIEVLGRSEQGKQEPFKCIASDGNLYYTKGRQTDRASLCNEWICANLAQALNLPLPPFSLLNASQELLEELPPDWKTLGEGVAFGSRQHTGCVWLDIAQVQHVPQQLQAEIFAFDWWIQNIDRMDANTNLLWDTSQKELVIIDHNLAFDSSINPMIFIENHIFRKNWHNTDLVTRDMLQDRFCTAMGAVLDNACDNIPPSWHWSNPECDVPAKVDLNAIRTTLARCQSPDFWRFA